MRIGRYSSVKELHDIFYLSNPGFAKPKFISIEIVPASIFFNVVKSRCLDCLGEKPTTLVADVAAYMIEYTVKCETFYEIYISRSDSHQTDSINMYETNLIFHELSHVETLKYIPLGPHNSASILLSEFLAYYYGNKTYFDNGGRIKQCEDATTLIDFLRVEIKSSSIDRISNALSLVVIFDVDISSVTSDTFIYSLLYSCKKSIDYKSVNEDLVSTAQNSIKRMLNYSNKKRHVD